MSRRLSKADGVKETIVGVGRIACLMLGAMAFSGGSAFGQAASTAQETPPAGEGRLYNVTSEPFVFQMHRADGAAWTENYNVAPGKFLAIKAPKAGETHEIQGLTGNGRGFIIIRHRDPVLGGYMTLRLPAQNPASGKIQPTWFAVKDSNGITRIVQEPSIEQAKEVQAALLKQSPMNAKELERSKHMLRANWVLTD